MWYSEKLQGYVIHNLFSIICVDTTCGNYVRELLSKIRIKSILFEKLWLAKYIHGCVTGNVILYY